MKEGRGGVREGAEGEVRGEGLSRSGREHTYTE